ncbi:unnamed protein product [Trichogramma brassicae]|uniref:Uncharacterized protein n=1 Tax=Trichogramma brassicae TaxID=86971 RepID=A0A6H5IQK6_9HYME|nr:unnamed protein product [Trichogramma brassicae]
MSSYTAQEINDRIVFRQSNDEIIKIYESDPEYAARIDDVLGEYIDYLEKIDFPARSTSRSPCRTTTTINSSSIAVNNAWNSQTTIAIEKLTTMMMMRRCGIVQSSISVNFKAIKILNDFDEGIKVWLEHYDYKLRIAPCAMSVVENLEKRGYELDQGDVLMIMKWFAKYGLFEKSEELEKCLYKDEEFRRAPPSRCSSSSRKPRVRKQQARSAITRSYVMRVYIYYATLCIPTSPRNLAIDLPRIPPPREQRRYIYIQLAYNNKRGHRRRRRRCCLYWFRAYSARLLLLRESQLSAILRRFKSFARSPTIIRKL